MSSNSGEKRTDKFKVLGIKQGKNKSFLIYLYFVDPTEVNNQKHQSPESTGAVNDLTCATDRWMAQNQATLDNKMKSHACTYNYVTLSHKTSLTSELSISPWDRNSHRVLIWVFSSFFVCRIMSLKPILNWADCLKAHS